jgi:trk system potassium uptake protein TrkH
MRTSVVSRIAGRFLQVFSVIASTPLLISVYYSESLEVVLGFSIAAFTALFLGYGFYFLGREGKPSTMEALSSTVAGWGMAIIIGAIPLLSFTSPVNAVFEASAGLTTTGISMFLQPELLPKSMLFWRALMQWIGGLGILTFFIAVIRESGGVSRRLFSAEAHKTDPGSIRPSLRKSIIDLWRVYGFMTSIIITSYIALGMPVFDSIAHAFSTISTGGFSVTSLNMAAYSTEIQAAATLFMFMGGVNFVLLYRFFRGDTRFFSKNSEFRLYSGFVILTGLFMLPMMMGRFVPGEAVLQTFFHAASVLSSTGFTMESANSFPLAYQVLVLGMMFMGGSLGSTAGGLKVFRISTMLELLRTRLRSYSLPETAVNEVKIDGEIIESSTVRTIAVLFFTWVSVAFLVTLAVMFIEDHSFLAILSGTISSAGNMGPVFMTGEELVSLSPVTKMLWMVVMLAGRLEMLPLLALFNGGLFKS